MEALFGGLLFVAGLSGAGLFVLGCFVGSKIQRDLGYVIKTRESKELLDQAKEREEKNYEANRSQASQGRKADAGIDAVDFLAKRKAAGHAHPVPMPPAPDDLPKPKSKDWVDSMGTERAKG